MLGCMKNKWSAFFFITVSVVFSSYSLGKVNHVLPRKEIHNSYCSEVSISYFGKGKVHLSIDMEVVI